MSNTGVFPEIIPADIDERNGKIVVKEDGLYVSAMPRSTSYFNYLA